MRLNLSSVAWIHRLWSSPVDVVDMYPRSSLYSVNVDPTLLAVSGWRGLTGRRRVWLMDSVIHFRLHLLWIHSLSTPPGGVDRPRVAISRSGGSFDWHVGWHGSPVRRRPRLTSISRSSPSPSPVGGDRQFVTVPDCYGFRHPVVAILLSWIHCSSPSPVGVNRPLVAVSCRRESSSRRRLP